MRQGIASIARSHPPKPEIGLRQRTGGKTQVSPEWGIMGASRGPIWWPAGETAERQAMDLSTLLLATTLAGLFLTGTGLLAAMVVLERPSAAARQGRPPPSRRTRPHRI